MQNRSMRGLLDVVGFLMTWFRGFPQPDGSTHWLQCWFVYSCKPCGTTWGDHPKADGCPECRADTSSLDGDSICATCGGWLIERRASSRFGEVWNYKSPQGVQFGESHCECGIDISRLECKIPASEIDTERLNQGEKWLA